MSRYRIFETVVFQKDLKRFSQPFQDQLVKKLHEYVYPQLHDEPHWGLNIKKLRGYRPETWRYQIGPWRLFYEIDEEEKVVALTALDKRSEAYRGR